MQSVRPPKAIRTRWALLQLMFVVVYLFGVVQLLYVTATSTADADATSAIAQHDVPTESGEDADSGADASVESSGPSGEEPGRTEAPAAVAVQTDTDAGPSIQLPVIGPGLNTGHAAWIAICARQSGQAWAETLRWRTMLVGESLAAIPVVYGRIRSFAAVPPPPSDDGPSPAQNSWDPADDDWPSGMLVIRNPRENGSSVRYLIDGRVCELTPGAVQRLAGERDHSIRYHLGEDLGEAEVVTATGDYAFRVSAAGWRLEVVN